MADPLVGVVLAGGAATCATAAVTKQRRREAEIEVQKRNKGTDRPPILPPPGFGDAVLQQANAAAADAKAAKP